MAVAEILYRLIVGSEEEEENASHGYDIFISTEEINVCSPQKLYLLLHCIQTSLDDGRGKLSGFVLRSSTSCVHITVIFI